MDHIVYIKMLKSTLIIIQNIGHILVVNFIPSFAV